MNKDCFVFGTFLSAYIISDSAVAGCFALQTSRWDVAWDCDLCCVKISIEIKYCKLKKLSKKISVSTFLIC